jgi:hypothetical protein
MCGHCHGGGDCYGWDYHPRYCGPRRRYYDEEFGPEDRRESLEEEKRILEKRLKDVESRLGEAGK